MLSADSSRPEDHTARPPCVPSALFANISAIKHWAEWVNAWVRTLIVLLFLRTRLSFLVLFFELRESALLARLFLRSFAPASGFPVRKRDNNPSSLDSQSPGIAVIDTQFYVVAITRTTLSHRPYNNYQSTIPYVITVSICCSSFLLRGWIFNFIGVRIPGANILYW